MLAQCQIQKSRSCWLDADDCALVAHSLEDAQMITDCFACAAKRFGLTISIKKTEVLKQERSGTSLETHNIYILEIPSYSSLTTSVTLVALSHLMDHWMERSQTTLQR